MKGETLAEQGRSVRYNILKREADTNRELYDGLLQRYKQVSAQAGATNNNITIIDRAFPPIEPVSPKPALNMALAGLAGLMMAVLFLFGREKLDDQVRIPDDVDRKLKIPLLGVVPLLKAKESLNDALRNPKSGLSEAHHALRTSLELASARGMPFSLLLTSSGQSEGKSSTAFAMARDFASSGKRILLVDGDLRKPSLHRLIIVSAATGLSNVLARQKTFGEVVQHSKINGFDFVPSGPLPPNPADLFAGGAMLELFATLRDHYDLVIIDGPPVLGLADAPRLGAAVDATLSMMPMPWPEPQMSRHALAPLALSKFIASAPGASRFSGSSPAATIEARR